MPRTAAERCFVGSSSSLFAESVGVGDVNDGLAGRLGFSRKVFGNVSSSGEGYGVLLTSCCVLERPSSGARLWLEARRSTISSLRLYGRLCRETLGPDHLLAQALLGQPETRA